MIILKLKEPVFKPKHSDTESGLNQFRIYNDWIEAEQKLHFHKQSFREKDLKENIFKKLVSMLTWKNNKDTKEVQLSAARLGLSYCEHEISISVH